MVTKPTTPTITDWRRPLRALLAFLPSNLMRMVTIFALWLILSNGYGGIDLNSRYPLHLGITLFILFALVAARFRSSSTAGASRLLVGAMALFGLHLIAQAISLWGSQNVVAGAWELMLGVDALLIFWLTFATGASEEKETGLNYWELLFTLFGTGVALLTILSRLISTQPTWLHFPRILYNPNHLAALLEMTLFFALFTTAKWRWIPITLQLLALAISLSRGAAMAVLITIVVSRFYFLPARQQINRRLTWIGVGAATLLVGIIQIVVNFSGDKNLLTSLFTRLDLWRGAMELFWQHPWWGIGSGSFAVAYQQLAIRNNSTLISTYAHSEPLQLLVEHGILGALPLLVGLIALLRVLRRHLPTKNPRLAATVSALLAVSLHALVDFHLRLPLVLLMFATLLSLLLTDCSHQNRPLSRLGFTVRRWRLALLGILLIGSLSMLVKIAATLRGNSTAHLQREIAELRQAERPLDALRVATLLDSLAPSSTSAITLAQLYQQLGNWKIAEELHQQAQKIDPHNANLQELWGQFLFESKRTRQALEIFQQYLNSHPEQLENVLAKVEVYITDPWQLKSMLPDNMFDSFARAERWLNFLIIRHHLEMALSEGITLLDKYPQERSLQLRLTQLELTQNNLAGAERRLTEMQKQFADPSGELLLLQARLTSRMGNHQKAGIYANELLHRDPTQTQALELVRQAVLKEPERAGWWQEELKKLTQKYPDNSDLQMEYADTLEKSGNWQEAVQIIKRQMSFHTRDNRFKLQLAHVYSRKKMYGPVLQIYRELLALEPQNPGHYLNLASLYRELKLTEQAITVIERGLVVAPENTTLQATLKDLEAIK